jgi:hypothetical protein
MVADHARVGRKKVSNGLRRVVTQSKGTVMIYVLYA